MWLLWRPHEWSHCGHRLRSTQVTAEALLCAWLGQVRACIQRRSTGGILAIAASGLEAKGSEDGFPSGPGLSPTPRVTLLPSCVSFTVLGIPELMPLGVGFLWPRLPGLYFSSVFHSCVAPAPVSTVSQVVPAGLLAPNLVLGVPFPTHIGLPTSWFPAAIRRPRRAGWGGPAMGLGTLSAAREGA